MKKIRIIFVFIVLSLFFYSRTSANTNSQSMYDKIERAYISLKDPFYAAVLSFFYSGAGHFYVGDYTKGSLLFFGETSFYIYEIFLISKLNNTYGVNAFFGDLNYTDRFLIVSGFYFYILLKAFSMYDAYKEALKYDKNILSGLKLSYKKGFYLEYTFRF